MAHLTDDAHELVTGYAKEYFDQTKDAVDGGIMSVTVYSDLAEHDIHQIADGFGREVFSLPSRYVEGGDHPNGYVIKFPEASSHGTANGKEQNRYEIEAWENRLADYRDYLVPIIDYHNDNWWIVMPRVDLVDTDSQEGRQRLDELRDAGFEFGDEVELGRYEGETLLLDYGYEVEVEV